MENLVGKKFNELIVIDKIENYSFKNNRTFIRWKCKCSCGNIIEVTSSRLTSGHVKSCGCLKHKKADMTGIHLHRLTFLHPDVNNKLNWICECDCGNIVSVNATNVKRGLTQSCGCLHSEVTSEKLTIDLVGKRFGKLVVIERDETMPKSQGVYWKCQCDCGNEVSIISYSLKEGTTTSCGCYKSKITSERFSMDLLGKKFGKLTVLNRDGSFVGENGAKYSQWLCKCECGSTKTIRGHDLVRGSVTSCGCTISRGEETIRILLNTMSVNFKTQYGFNDLKSKKGWKLKFDFAIMNSEDMLLCLLEFQGQQHYDESYGWFGEQQRNETDPLKRQYCNQHNIPLFEIKYNDDIETSIKNILSNFEIYKSIPCQASLKEEGVTTIRKE
ncbi:hypothetical protein DS742_14090 [Lacrimispora amygdalina]|uniref:DUF2726 domain-containing protein n=1 Tax=Lacrimispora amygdalina TaxID=253257 RepID=A0A3E2NBH8_9FIRM|nr:hypothetical protein [Clostridium indicum]RFZ78240.1 hypothetical protein DS742_14090 [Clostridium indicum]